MASSEHSIGTRTARGVVWAYGSFVGGRMLSLLATAILARVLTPEEFGLVALAMTMIALLEGVADLGLSQALVVQSDEVVEERANTVFGTSVALGLVASVIIAALGPAAASFFGEPDLTGIAAALGSIFFLRSLGGTHYALAQRGLDFRARTAAEFADVFVRGLTGIGFALAGFGAWSLVLGYLAGTISLVVVIWALVPWRPRHRPRMSQLREMIGFGGTLSGVNIVAAVIANIDYLFVGRVLGASSLGLYTLGFRLPELLVLNVAVVAGDVLFAAFSAIDRESLVRAFLVSFRYVLLVALPVSAFLIVLADPVILGLFGDQWGDSVVPMQILTLYALAVAVDIPAGTAYKATGRAGVLLVIGVIRLAVLVVALVLFVDRGIEAVAISQGGAAALSSAAAIVVACRLLSVRPGRLVEAAWPALAGTVLLALLLLATNALIDAIWPTLLIATPLGAVAYLGFLRLVAPDTITFLREKMMPGVAEAELDMDEPTPAVLS